MERIEAVTRACGRLAGWLVLAMVVLGALTPLVRWFGSDLPFGTMLSAGYEGQWYLFSAVFLLAGAAVLADNRHVRVDIFYARFRVRTRAWIDLIGSLGLLLPFAVFGLIASWHPVMRSIARAEPAPSAGGLPRYPLKALLLVGFALLALQAIAEACRHWRAILASRPVAPLVEEPVAAAKTRGDA